MDRRLLLCFLLFTLTLGISQTEQLLIRGIIRDSITTLPLPDANIAIQGVPFIGTSTNQEGAFSIKTDSLPLALIITSIGYKTRIIQVDDTNPLDLYLSPSTINLSEIIVRAKPKIDTVFHEPYNVMDYVFSGDQILLLVYRNVSEQHELVLLDEYENTLDRLSLKKEKPISLFKSCVDSIYLNTFYGVYRIFKSKKSIIIGEEISEQRFEQFIKPCLLAKDDFYFFQQYFYQGQAVHFYSLVAPYGAGADPDSLVILPMVEDEQQIVRLIEDAGYSLPWSGDFWDKHISGGLQSLRDGPYALKGVMRMFYPKLYIPVFSVGDDLCIINHHHSRIQYFDHSGNLLREVPIDYHRTKHWKKIVFQDELTQKVYTAFDSKWGEYICPIDLKTGALEEALELEIDFSEKVKIKNGVLYFLHRNPYVGIGNKILKKIRID